MLKAWKDEAEHGNDTLPQTELSPDEGHVFDVEIQLGPLIGVIVCPHLDLGPARLDCTSVDGKKLDGVYADDVMLGVETDYAVSTDGEHRDALESLDACFPGEAVRGEEAADGPGGDRLGLAALQGRKRTRQPLGARGGCGCGPMSISKMKVAGSSSMSSMICRMSSGGSLQAVSSFLSVSPMGREYRDTASWWS